MLKKNTPILLLKRIIYQEHKDKLNLTHISDEEFQKLRFNKINSLIDKYEVGEHIKLISKHPYCVLSIFEIVKRFSKISNIDNMDMSDDTILYITICALGAIHDNDKSHYKQYFSELRLRNAYGLLEDITYFLQNFLPKIGTFFNNSMDLLAMFKNDKLFSYIIRSLIYIIKINNINIKEFTSLGDKIELCTKIGDVFYKDILIYIYDEVTKNSNINLSNIKKEIYNVKNQVCPNSQSTHKGLIVLKFDEFDPKNIINEND